MAVLDRIFSVPALPTGPTKLYATDMLEVGGGPASTAAAAIVKLGGRARLFARLGQDSVGDTVLAGLEADGIDTAGVRRIEGARSAWSAVAVEPWNGERLIINTPGEGLDVEADWLGLDDLAGAGSVLVDMGWIKAAARLLLLARQAAVPSVLDADLGPHAGAVGLIGLADHVVFSAAGLAHHATTDDPIEGLRRMRLWAPESVLAVTLGAEGFLWLDGDTPRRVPAPRVEVVDTLGAGDVFHGAYALALAEGAGVEAAAHFANTAAALKCTRPGGRAGTPTRAEVQKALSPWERVG